MIVQIKKGDLIVAHHAVVAATFFSRIKGLLGTKKIDDALLIKRCNSVHTFFMQYNLDLLFIDKNLKVVKAIYNLPPFRISAIYWRSTMVLEMMASSMPLLNKGDQLEIVCLS